MITFSFAVEYNLIAVSVIVPHGHLHRHLNICLGNQSSAMACSVPGFPPEGSKRLYPACSLTAPSGFS